MSRLSTTEGEADQRAEVAGVTDLAIRQKEVRRDPHAYPRDRRPD
jgi:hypothetical protein